MSVKMIRKVILEDCEIRASEKTEKGLDYEIVEKIIEENYIHKITIQELVSKVNQVASSKCGTIVVEVMGAVRTPVIIYESDFKAFISQKETEDGVEESFKIVSYDDEIGNLEFDTLAAKEVVWDKW